MDRGFAWLVAAALLPLSACRHVPPPEALARAEVELVEEPAWRAVASAGDSIRIDRLDQAWDRALGQAHRAGYARVMAREGALLAPGAALPIPTPTPGSYRCRLIRFGPAVPGGDIVTAYRPFFCYIGADGEALSIIKQTGTQRPSGYLWVDRSASRLVFLGSLAEGPRDVLLPYGADRRRDMAAVFERIDDFRFRLVVPWPRSGAVLDVYELVPNVISNDRVRTASR